MVGQNIMQIHKAQCRERRAKGQRKNFVCIFLVLPLNMNFVSHSVALFCLTCCFHLYIPGKLVMFLDLEEVTLCRICPLCPSHSLLSGPQSSVVQGCPLCVLQGYFCCGELTNTGSLVRPLSSRLAGSALCPGCWPLLGGAGHETAD